MSTRLIQRVIVAVLAVSLIADGSVQPARAAETTAPPTVESSQPPEPSPGPSTEPVPTPRPTSSEPVSSPAPDPTASGDPLASASPEPSATPDPRATPDSIEGAASAPAAFDPSAEIISERTETSRSSDNGDGTMTTEVFPEPIHYRPAGAPDWARIELEFEPVAGQPGRAAVAKSPVAVTVGPANDKAGFLAVVIDGHRIAFRPAAGAASAVAPVARDAVADLRDVLPGVDLRVFPSADGVNTFLVLDELPAEPSFTFSVDAPTLRLAIDPETGGAQFTDREGRAVAALRAPYAVDSTADEEAGGGRMTTDVTYEVGKAGGQTTLTVSLGRAWLEAATYPVFVDPSIYSDGDNTFGDAHVDSGSPSVNFGNYKRPDSPAYYELMLGENPADSSSYNEAYIRFHMADVAGTTIDSASLRVYPYHQYYNAPSASNTWVRRVTGYWAENTITWNNKPSVVLSTIITDGLVEGQLSDFDVTYWVRTWLDGTNYNYGLRLDQNGNGPTYWKRLVAAEQASTNSPHLVVTNHRPAATATTPTGWRNSRTLSWSYGDPSGHAQSDYEVQVSTSSSFSSILTTSGATAGAGTSWTIPSGVTLWTGTTYYWRVRVKDGTSQLLAGMPSYATSITVRKSAASLRDLSALTAHTGVEFAMLTRGSHRMLLRGGVDHVPIGPEVARDLASQGWRLSAHTHPGTGEGLLRSSVGDRAVLASFGGSRSLILNSGGDWRIFSPLGDLLTGWLPK